jgi:tetratricopeptide (TPR) repeat protein
MFDKLRRTCSASIVSLLLGAAPLTAATVEGDAATSFIGNGFDWLFLQPQAPSPAGSGEPEALRQVATFFRDKNPRAALALEAYLKRFPNDPAAFDLAGVVLMQDMDYENAAISFRKAIQIDPQNSWSWSKLGASLLLHGDIEAADAALRRANEIDPDNPLALRFMAAMAVQAGNLPEAVMRSERALRAFGLPGATVNQAHFDLAELYARIGRHSDTLELLGPAVRNNDLVLPEDARLELYGRYMDAAMQVGDAKLARVAMNRIKPLVNVADPRVQLSEARLLRLEGDATGALAQIEAIAAANPEMVPQLRGDLAQFLEGAGQVDAAVTQLSLAVTERGPDHDIDFLREIAAVLIRANRNEDAVALIAKAAADASERQDLQLLDAETLSKAGQLSAAMIKVDGLLAANPENTEALFLAGTLAAAKGDTVAGAAFLERALAIDPAQPQVWLTLAGTVHGHDSYTGGGHDAASAGHDTVETLLLRAVAANPDSADLHAELGLLYLSDGRVQEAIAAFDSAVKASPGNIAGLSLGALARADLGEDLETARAMMERASAAAPDEPINQDILGWVMARQGQVDEGIALMMAALDAAPGDVTIRYHLGVAEMDRGNIDMARPHLMASLAGGNYTHNVADARARILKAYPATEVEAQVNLIDGAGVGATIGTITLRQTDAGLEVTTDLQSLPPGKLAMHVHLNPTCEPDGGVAGALAQGHYGADHHAADATPAAAHDHAETEAETAAVVHDHDDNSTAAHSHDAPAAAPSGDLPFLKVATDGTARGVFIHRAVTLYEIRARSLMIHADATSPVRIACAVIP